MSVDAASALAPAAGRSRVREHAWTIGIAVALSAAFAVRVALAWRRSTPEYFPDEYIYAALGRSIAHLQGTTIRGGAAHFPALLQPLLTAPAWRVGGVETGYRLVQAIESAFFTLAAVPVYLLARRLALPRSLAAFAAAIALLVPDGVYASFVLADPIAYPFAMAAILVGLGALVRPRLRTQLLFLVLAGLATAARIQFVVLPLCYLAGAFVLGLRERSLRRMVREQREVVLLLALIGAVALASGPSRVIGYYRSALHLHPHPLAVLSSAGQNLLVLAHAGGWIVVPGALLGLGLALARPRTRLEASFGAFVPMLAVALLVEATVFGGTDKVHERYAFYLVPLAAVSFGLYVSRGWPLRRLHLGLLAGMFLLSTQPFLAGWAQVGSDDHAPFLYAVHWLELRIGNGPAAVAIAAVKAALCLMLAATIRRPRLGTPVILAAATAVCAASVAGAFAFDGTNSHHVAANLLPADYSWVDHAHAGPVTLVAGYDGKQAAAEAQLFWNQSIQRVAVLQGGLPPDAMAASPIHVDIAGTLTVRGRPLRGALLLDEYGGTMVPRGGKILGRSPAYTLWRPDGPPRLALYMPGRYSNGLLASKSEIIVWPARPRDGIAGWVRLRITAAPGRKPLQLTIRHAARTWHFRVPAGRTVPVRIPVCSNGPWLADLSAPSSTENLFQQYAGATTAPRLVAGRAGCGRAAAATH